MRQQITSTVTKQYKQETKHRNIRYTIKENFDQYPEVEQDYQAWRSKQNPVQQATFAGIFHPEHKQSMFDIRDAEIREDWGQRNALLEKGRKPKILGMAKNFDPQLFEAISVDYIADKGAYIIRDGGGRAHAAYLCGIYEVPATVRYLKNHDESRRLFNAQDKYATSISSYDKFLQQLLNKDHMQHNVAKDMWSIAKSSGFCLHHSSKSNSTPLVEGIGVLRKIISTVGGDNKNVKPGERVAANLCMAVDLIKHAFPDADEIPASLLYGLTSYIHISGNRIPSGDEGIKRLKQFAVDVRDSNEELKDLNRWISYMHFGAGQNIPKMGAAALMEKWNELYRNKNRGKSKSTYRWVKWETQEINITKENIMPFARDESLLPE